MIHRGAPSSAPYHCARIECSILFTPLRPVAHPLAPQMKKVGAKAPSMSGNSRMSGAGQSEMGRSSSGVQVGQPYPRPQP